MGVPNSSQLVAPKLLRLRPSCIYATPILRNAIFFSPTPVTWPVILRNVSSASASKAPATTSSSHLKGTTCMITGGASGIGFAIAQRFLREGAGKVILVGRRKERLLNALDRLRRTYEQDYGDHITVEYSAAEDTRERTSSGADSSAGEGILSSPQAQHKSLERHDRSEYGQLALIAGDVGDPSFWNDNIKKSMVSIRIPLYVAKLQNINLSISLPIQYQIAPLLHASKHHISSSESIIMMIIYPQS